MSAGKYPGGPILLVDDEEQLLRSFDNMLREHGINNTLRCTDSRDVESILRNNEPEAIVLDLTMPHISGEELLPVIMRICPQVPVIIATGANQVEIAVQCMKMGVLDYLVKPVSESHLIASVRKALEVRELRRENRKLARSLLAQDVENPEAFSDIITSDAAMISVFKYIGAIAESIQCVLITGETGTGKELIARSIHTLSGRTGAFVPVNVSGLDDTMFSDTLFGHVKGAYTGAGDDRPGLVEHADDGTLFLDEIGDMSIASQVKILRLMQEHEYLPLGADDVKSASARVVVATNKEVDELLRDEKFRSDLYYRIQTHHIHLPPLRERRGDLPVLFDHFLEKSASALGKERPEYSDELLHALDSYDFPGNIREMESMVHDAVSRHVSGHLALDVFLAHMGGGRVNRPPVSTDSSGDLLLFRGRVPTLAEATDELISEALKRSSGNQTAAAKMLGISRQTLNKRLHDG